MNIRTDSKLIADYLETMTDEEIKRAFPDNFKNDIIEERVA